MNKQAWIFANRKPIIASLVFLVLWEIVSEFGLIGKLFISSPSEIIVQAYTLFSSGAIIPDLIISLEIFLAGMILAIAVGFSLGLLVGFFEEIGAYAQPFVFMLGSIPKIALVPILIFWFGIGFDSKIAIVFLMAVVPVLINTIDGTKNVSSGMLTMAKSFGSSKFFILRKVVFFETLPYFFSGARSAVSRGILGLIVADMFGSAQGLGYLIEKYGASFRTDRLMVIVCVLLAISLTTVWFIDIIEKRVVYWNR